MQNKPVITSVTIDIATGKIERIKREPWDGQWVLCEDGDTDDDTDDKSSDNKSDVDIDSIKKENADLKASLSKVNERLEKLDKLDKERDERRKKKEEEERIKKEGHAKLLEEKDEALKTASARLEAFERRQMEAADKMYQELPEEVRGAIEPMRDKLDTTDWVDLVERHYEIKAKSNNNDSSGGSFMRPGDSSKGKSGKYEPAAKTMAIIEDIGRGHEGIKILTRRQEVDEESNQRVTKFTRQIRAFVKDLNPLRTHKLEWRK